MIRVNVVAEGQSEMKFVKDSLNRYFGGVPLMDSRSVLTSRNSKTNYEYRGGLLEYRHAKGDILRWFKEDPKAHITTMFDFFRLPSDFPGYEKAMACQDHRESVRILEEELKSDIISKLEVKNPERRFIPYIQLHEFEALLFTDIKVLKYDYILPEEIAQIEKLYEGTKGIPPEEINHGAETAPSKRLLQAVDYKKGETVSELLNFIGIPAIRKKCPHFSEWLEKLQNLPEL
ncbi:MAG: DUF4276 family protein [Lachnospiraceae bacterium]|nr:DUF4276 family protein [Lachnospiraceae bacterium]